MKRHGAPKRHRAPFDPGRFVTEPTTKFKEQAGFADSRLASDKDDLPVARPGLLEALKQQLQLALATDKGCQPPLSLYLQARAGDAGRDHFPGTHRLGLSLESKRPQWSGVEVACHKAVRGLGNQDPPRVSRRLETRRHVRRVPHRSVVHAQIVPDAPYYHEPSIEALPHLEADPLLALEFRLVALQGLADPQGCKDGAPCMILVRNRRSEEGHNAVAEELVHCPLVAVHLR